MQTGVAEIILRPADLFATRGRGWLACLIRFCTRTIGESRTMVNHVGVITEGGPLQDAIAVEALCRVQRHPLLARYGGKKASDVAVFRPLNLTDDEKQTVVSSAELYVGRRYGFLKLLAHLADWLLQGIYFFRRLAVMDKYPICSWLVAHAFAKVGKNFGKEPGAASPDDIWDFIQRNPERYETVIPLGPLSLYQD